MNPSSCYLCRQELPAGQSFYEDHGVKVCLTCFRQTPRCKKCKFPSQQLKAYPGLGLICEFCQQNATAETGMACYLCQRSIPAWMSHYADYGKTVCQTCFQEAKVRCFLCRFPQVALHIQGLGGVCEFCQPDLLQKGTELGPILEPLPAFLKRYQHRALKSPKLQWLDWHLLLGMQGGAAAGIKIQFLDELLHFCYPVYFLKGQFYVIPGISRQLFLVHMTGQMVAADLCARYGQPHLLGDSPFFRLARGWAHWMAYSVAGLLHYQQIEKLLRRWPEEPLCGDFPKLLAMMEYRRPGEMVQFAHQTLRVHAQKYL